MWALHWSCWVISQATNPEVSYSYFKQFTVAKHVKSQVKPKAIFSSFLPLSLSYPQSFLQHVVSVWQDQTPLYKYCNITNFETYEMWKFSSLSMIFSLFATVTPFADTELCRYKHPVP